MSPNFILATYQSSDKASLTQTKNNCSSLKRKLVNRKFTITQPMLEGNRLSYLISFIDERSDDYQQLVRGLYDMGFSLAWLNFGEGITQVLDTTDRTVVWGISKVPTRLFRGEPYCLPLLLNDQPITR